MSTQLSKVKVFLGWRVQVNNRDHGDQGKLGDQGCQVLLVDQGGGGGTPSIRNLTNLVFARGGLIPSAPDMQISIRRSLLNQYRFFRSV